MTYNILLQNCYAERYLSSLLYSCSVSQATRDWNSEDNFANAIRIPMAANTKKQISFTPHLLWDTEACTRTELSSLISQSQLFLPHFDIARMFLSLLFWNWPIPTLLQVTPTQEEIEDVLTRALLPRSMPFPPTQAYKLLLFSMFSRTMRRAADNLHKCISTWHKLKALHRFRVCAFKGWQGGSIWTKGREREQGKVLSHSSWETNSRTCEAANSHRKSKEHNFQDQVWFRSRI